MSELISSTYGFFIHEYHEKGGHFFTVNVNGDELYFSTLELAKAKQQKLIAKFLELRMKRYDRVTISEEKSVDARSRRMNAELPTETWNLLKLKGMI